MLPLLDFSHINADHLKSYVSRHLPLHLLWTLHRGLLSSSSLVYHHHCTFCPFSNSCKRGSKQGRRPFALAPSSFGTLSINTATSPHPTMKSKHMTILCIQYHTVLLHVAFLATVTISNPTTWLQSNTTYFKD